MSSNQVLGTGFVPPNMQSWGEYQERLDAVMRAACEAELGETWTTYSVLVRPSGRRGLVVQLGGQIFDEGLYEGRYQMADVTGPGFEELCSVILAWQRELDGTEAGPWQALLMESRRDEEPGHALLAPLWSAERAEAGVDLAAWLGRLMSSPLGTPAEVHEALRRAEGEPESAPSGIVTLLERSLEGLGVWDLCGCLISLRGPRNEAHVSVVASGTEAGEGFAVVELDEAELALARISVLNWRRSMERFGQEVPEEVEIHFRNGSAVVRSHRTWASDHRAPVGLSADELAEGMDLLLVRMAEEGTTLEDVFPLEDEDDDADENEDGEQA